MEAIKQWQYQHLFLTIAVLVFAGISSYLALTGPVFKHDPELSNILSGAAGLLALGSTTAGRLIFRKRVAGARLQESTHAKLAHYQTAWIVEMALLEGGCFFALVVWMLTASIVITPLAAVMILLLIRQRPTVEKVTNHLGLQPEDLAQEAGQP